MEAHKCVFMNPDRVQVISDNDTSLRSDWFILSGYPKELTQVNKKGVSCKFSHFSTKSSHSETAPNSPVQSNYADVHVFDLVLPLDSAFDNVNESRAKSFIPRLPGASGGGCWKANLYPNPETWDASRLRLVGTHQGSSNVKVIDGRDYVFARHVSIEHHLSLISSDYIDLRKEITSYFPDI